MLIIILYDLTVVFHLQKESERVHEGVKVLEVLYSKYLEKSHVMY